MVLQRVGHDWATFTSLTNTSFLGAVSLCLSLISTTFHSFHLDPLPLNPWQLSHTCLIVAKLLFCIVHLAVTVSDALKLFLYWNIVDSQCCVSFRCAYVLSHVWFCDTMYCSPPGSSIHGIFQARILEWVALSFSRGPSWPRDWTSVSCISCFGRRILYHYATWEASFRCTAKWFQVYIYIYIYIYHISILFQLLFPYRLLQNIKYSSLCYTVGPCWLSVLHIAVWLYQSQLPVHSSSPPSPLDNHKPTSKSLNLFSSVNKFSCIIFLDSTYK